MKQSSVESKDYGTTTDENNEMAVSKEANEVNDEMKRATDNGIMKIIMGAAKKVAVVGIIYLFGYMEWSFGWLVCPVLLTVYQQHKREEGNIRRDVAKASALASDKEVILARLDDLPAWVFFPDIERCEWLNRILKQVWPNANHFTRNLFKETIEPNVVKTVGSYGEFKFERIILGVIPPRIGGVKVYDKNISRDEVIMDLDFYYAGDCDISFSLGRMRGGIKDLQISGKLRIVLKPLIATMPLFGGMQIFFLKNPQITYKLSGAGEFLEFPGMDMIIQSAIEQQVASLLVLPNKLPIILSDQIDTLALKMPEPEGVLRVHVVEAKNLMKMDISMLGKGKSDPYAIVTVGAQQFRTKTIDNTVNPKWDYWCEAIVLADSGQSIDIQLYDKDDAKEDERLGMATVEISQVVKKGEVDTWLTLEQAKHGMVHLRMTWMKLTTERNDLKAALAETQLLRVNDMSTALLTLFIDSAKNLPQARQQSQPDPYIIISCGKKNEQTSIQMRTDAPVWEQGFTFLVGNPENDTLQLRVMDNKTGNEIGKFTFILAQIMEKKNMDVIKQPFQLQKSGPESKIIMAMSLRILKTVPAIVEQEEVIPPKDNAAIVKEPLKKQDSRVSQVSINEPKSVEEAITATNAPSVSASPPSPSLSLDSASSFSLKRNSSIRLNAEPGSLGKINMSLKFSTQRQRLTVTVVCIKDLPLKDPSNIPDPYVKLYLLPGRNKDTKRKTNFIKDNCNPVYNATFEYLISTAELNSSELEISVLSKKGFLSSPVIGMCKIDLSNSLIKDAVGFSTWVDLQPETDFKTE